MEELFATPLVSAVIGGLLVAFINAIFSRRKMQSEIENKYLIRAYHLLQEATVTHGAEEDFKKGITTLTEEKRREMVAKCQEAVLIIDLFGSRKLLRAIREAVIEVPGSQLSGLNISLLRALLRVEIRKRMGITTFAIPQPVPMGPTEVGPDICTPQELMEG